MATVKRKTRPTYNAEIKFRCPEAMTDTLVGLAEKEQKDKSDVSREVFALGLTAYLRRRTREVRRAS
jgi:hypothetical protein